MTQPVVAAISLNPRGGGVARVSSLVWRVFAEHWGDRVRLATLARRDAVESSTGDRLRFGADLAAAQLTGECPWIFYTHLRIARVQAQVPRPFRRPYGIFLHGIEAWRPLTRPERRVLEGASLLVANSDYTARRIADAHPWLRPVEACPLALPPAAGLEAAASDDVPALGPRVVLVVARMSAAERYKGHDQLLDAWPAVLMRAPGAQLVFVGAGDDVGRLHARAEASGIGGSVVFTGFVSDGVLESLYRRAALFAMPSRDEGLGLVYLEAMAHGLPCVGSVHDAAREVIDDGVTGYLVEQSDVAGLANRIAGLLVDDDTRRAMGARGRSRGQRRFGYDRFRDRLLSLALSSLAGGAAPETSQVGAPALGRSRP